MDRRAAEHTAQTIHQRLIATVAGQRPDYTGERTERIRTIFVLRAVRHLARYHRPAQRSLSTVVGRLYAWIIQKTQQVATVIVPAKLVLKPPVVTIRPPIGSRGQASGGLADDNSPLVSTAPSPQHSPTPLPDDMTASVPSPL